MYKIKLRGHFNKTVLNCTLPNRAGDRTRYISYYPPGNGSGALLIIGDPHSDKQAVDIVGLDRPDGKLQLSSEQLSMLKQRMTTENPVKIGNIFRRKAGDGKHG